MLKKDILPEWLTGVKLIKFSHVLRMRICITEKTLKPIRKEAGAGTPRLLIDFIKP